MWKLIQAIPGDEHEAEVAVREKDPTGGLQGNLKCQPDSVPMTTGPAGNNYTNSCEVRWLALNLQNQIVGSGNATTYGAGLWSFSGLPTGKSFALKYAINGAENYHEHDGGVMAQKLYNMVSDSTGPLSTVSGKPGTTTPQARELGTTLLSPHN